MRGQANVRWPHPEPVKRTTSAEGEKPMSTFSNNESANASPAANTATQSDDERSHSQSLSRSGDETNTPEPPTLEMTRCPECGARRFVSKLLVYEVTSYTEGGTREFRRQHVRAEFEFTCGECQTQLRTLPADRRDYYDEVQVLAAERRAVFRNQIQRWCRQFWQRLWAAKVQIAVVIALVTAVCLSVI
jgi:hypothetical protein